MTIVELIDVHGGFSIITNRITTRKKVTLLWLISILTFFMSAVLDNMTTAIVMVMLIRRIIPEQKERWLFASIIIIAANSGGAWSPIGDVTTIMLWVKGNVTSVPLVESLLLPSLVSTIVPVWIASRSMHGMITSDGTEDKAMSNVEQVLTPRERLTMLILGVSCLLFVPVFKSLTHLPPFMGIMVGLGIMWVYTELLYRKKVDVAERDKHRVTQVIRHIDIPTILFSSGFCWPWRPCRLRGFWMLRPGSSTGNCIILISSTWIIGLMSSIVDNVPLVAGAMGMYPIVDPAMVGTMADPAFMQHFVQGRSVLVVPGLLCRRRRQPADYRLSCRCRGDGTRKDQFRVVPEADYVDGTGRISGRSGGFRFNRMA
ncbi:MAG: sodium:proton antiporter NhaD [Alistipes indistinctus]